MAYRHLFRINTKSGCLGTYSAADCGSLPRKTGSLTCPTQLPNAPYLTVREATPTIPYTDFVQRPVWETRRHRQDDAMASNTIREELCRCWSKGWLGLMMLYCKD